MAKQMDDSLFEDTKFQEPQKYDDSLFEDTKSQEIEVEPKVSQLESGIRGAAQGLTFGFSDELTAAAEAALKTATGQEEATNILDTYRKARDESRQAYEEAKQAHPGTYLTGEIVGGVAPALVSGGATALASGGLKAAALAGAKTGAAVGALSGLGAGKADLTQGELGKAALETGVSATIGAGLGAAFPVAAKGLSALKESTKKQAVKIGEKIQDMSGELGDLVVKAGKLTAQGEEIVSKKALEQTTKDIANSAETLAKTVNDVTRTKAKNLISESLNSEQKINLTDTVDDYVSKLDTALSELVPDSAEAKVLGNIKAKFTKMKTDLLKEAGQDPTLPTKQEAYKKLLEKKETLEAIQATGAPESRAIDNLFNTVAKMKGKWKPDSLSVEKIQKQFNLPDADTTIEMLKDVAKLQINKPKMMPILKADGKPLLTPDGKPIMQLEDIPVELSTVIKRYQPEIIEQNGRLMLQRAPGKISESDVLKFRPDLGKQDIQLTPQQTLNLRDELRGLTFGQEGLTKKIGSEITEDLTSKLKSGITPQAKSKFEEGMGIYQDIYALEDLLGVQFKNLVDKQGKFTSEGEQAIKKLSSFIEKQMPDTNPAQQMNILEGVKERILKSVPELGEEFLQKTGKQAQLKELQQSAYKTGSIRALGTIESMGIRAGAAAGNIVKRLRDTGEVLSGKNIIDKISNATSDQLNKASQLYRSTGNEKAANFLAELSTVTSQQKKNALLFTASQNPNLRKELFAEEKEE